MFYKRILVLFLATFFFLMGCNSPVYNQTEANVADVSLRTKAADARMTELGKKEPTLVVNQGLYVDRTPISLMRQPGWLKNRIILHGDQLPFSYYNRLIIEGGNRNIMTHYQNGLDEKNIISINYAGSIKGALDMLAAKTGYVYTVNGSDIYWHAYITKTFDIAFMPGSSDYLMGKTSSAGSTGQAAQGPGGMTSVTGTIDDSASAQYSNLKGTLSVWKDLESSIKQLLSPEGRVMVSEATTSVTVRDRPPNVNLITRFINNLNNNLSRQVLVKVEVLTVTLENDFNFGINWNVVQRAFNNGKYNLVNDNGAPILLQTSTQLSLKALSLGVNNTFQDNENGKTATGILALINALSQQGKVSIVTQPQVLCQNNQVSQIRIVDQLGYLASVQTTALSGGSSSGGSSTVTSQITPGAVVTGLTLYVLPKILGNKVYLQVNADLSNNLGLTTISSNGSTIDTTTGTSSNVSAIQVPHIQQKQFNQRAIVATGDTLVMAGFRQTTNITGASQLLQSQALGGKTAQQVNSETVVLITPIILRGVG